MLKKFLFHTLWIPIKVSSYLPLGVLYGMGNLLSFVLYRVVRYRRSVVRENLQACFVEKNQTDILRIERAYYRHIGMLLVEFWKQLTVAEDFYRKHVDLEGFELFENYQREGRSVMLVMGHVNSWEWALQRIVGETSYPFYTLYRPLTNPDFDRMVYKVRTKTGAHVIDMQHALRFLLNNRESALGGCFIADQNPPRQNAIWTNFLGRDTAFFSGFQKIAIRLNQPVIYVEVNRIRKGRYKVKFRLLSEAPGESTEQQLTDQYASFLSDHIRKQPESWLWSHRRWKYTRET